MSKRRQLGDDIFTAGVTLQSLPAKKSVRMIGKGHPRAQIRNSWITPMGQLISFLATTFKQFIHNFSIINFLIYALF